MSVEVTEVTWSGAASGTGGSDFSKIVASAMDETGCIGERRYLRQLSHPVWSTADALHAPATLQAWPLLARKRGSFRVVLQALSIATQMRVVIADLTEPPFPNSA